MTTRPVVDDGITALTTLTAIILFCCVSAFLIQGRCRGCGCGATETSAKRVQQQKALAAQQIAEFEAEARPNASASK